MYLPGLIMYESKSEFKPGYVLELCQSQVSAVCALTCACEPLLVLLFLSIPDLVIPFLQAVFLIADSFM